MKYKIIFCDIDGTLVDSQGNITQCNIEYIKKATELGVKFVLCSGRSCKSLLKYMRLLNINEENNFLVSFNGGLIRYSGEVLHKNYLDKSEIIEIYNELKKTDTDCEVIIYQSPELTLCDTVTDIITFYKKISLVDFDVITDLNKQLDVTAPKIMATSENPGSLISVYDRLLPLASRLGVNMFFSSKYLLEFTSKKATKGHAITTVVNSMSMDLSCAIAIGDNFNDLSMIQAAGLGVCVNNGESVVKNAADYITEADNNEGAVAEVIKKFILQAEV